MQSQFENLFWTETANLLVSCHSSKKNRLELRYSQFFSMGRVKFLFLRFSAFLGRQVFFWHFLMSLFLYWSGNTLNLWESLACKLNNRGDKDIKKVHLKLIFCNIIESICLCLCRTNVLQTDVQGIGICVRNLDLQVQSVWIFWCPSEKCFFRKKMSIRTEFTKYMSFLKMFFQKKNVC